MKPRLALFLVLLSGALMLAACGAVASSPIARAVSVETTACGHASRTSGAGVIVEDGWVLSAAHVVAGAGSVDVVGPFGRTPADIVVLDRQNDLALLRVEGATASLVEIAEASPGDELLLGGGGPSGSFSATILRAVDVRIEAVRSEERVSRLGYEIDERVALGDSGGGVYDTDGHLVGVVFGRPLAQSDRTFVVRHEAITGILDAERTSVWQCDAANSGVLQVDSG